MQWLRDGLGLIATAAETQAVAESVPDTQGVYLVPAFAGLGAPYWDMYARGGILGITRGTRRAHIVRAALESIAYQTRDLTGAIEAATGIPFTELRVDGGACRNDFLMQFQADLLGCPVNRSRYLESTGMGAAFLAGLAVGVWAVGGGGRGAAHLGEDVRAGNQRGRTQPAVRRLAGRRSAREERRINLSLTTAGAMGRPHTRLGIGALNPISGPHAMVRLMADIRNKRAGPIGPALCKLIFRSA